MYGDKITMIKQDAIGLLDYTASIISFAASNSVGAPLTIDTRKSIVIVNGVIFAPGNGLAAFNALAALFALFNTAETDPVFQSSIAFTITPQNITNWNTAYGWGNPAGLYKPITYVPSWTEITSKPTTLSGYGITDAYPLNSNPAGYLTSSTVTETDPVWLADKPNYLSISSAAATYQVLLLQMILQKAVTCITLLQGLTVLSMLKILMISMKELSMYSLPIPVGIPAWQPKLPLI
jgi:hypothetical protein